MAIEILPSWNLKDLYKSEKDGKINVHLSSSLQKAREFQERYREKLTPSASEVLQALQQYESIYLVATKPVLYSNLLFAESCNPPGRGAFMQNVRAEYLKIHQQLLFFELEMLKFSVSDLTRLKKDPKLKNYSHYLGQLIESKPHRLSEKEEQILADKNHTGSGAFVRFFDEELASKKFYLHPKTKKQQQVSETEVLALLYSSKREIRAEGARSLTEGLKEEARRLTYVFNILAEDKAIEDRYRNYQSPEHSRHIANQIDQKTVDAMSGVVTKNYKIVQDFYTFKRKVLGYKEIYDYDRYAPVQKKQISIPFKEAKTLVLDAFYGFDKEIGDIVKQFFDKKWIDAAKRPGKRGGAFCSFVTPDLHPYVFVNYSGTMREVFTLAHELGHAVHAYLMRGQTFLNFDTPLTIAETASVFAEMLLFDRMKEALKDRKEELFSLYVGKIENIFATVFRQISMYRFEQDLHRARQERGELQTDQINQMWRARQEEMFGRSVVLTKGYDYWWSYIPHFVHTPFYVYAYAFGELLTLALFAQYKKQGRSFISKYKKFLASGGSVGPKEALAQFNIKLDGSKFWEGGVRMVKQMVDELVK